MLTSDKVSRRDLITLYILTKVVNTHLEPSFNKSAVQNLGSWSSFLNTFGIFKYDHADGNCPPNVNALPQSFQKQEYSGFISTAL